MRDLFPGYMRARPEALQELWKSARIAVDANVLLNVYRYSETTRDQLVDVFERLKERLWLPWQFAKEFYDNRGRVVLEQSTAYLTARRAVEQLLEDFKSFKKHPFVSVDRIQQLEAFAVELGDLGARREEILHDDPILQRIESIFDGRVGEAPTPDQLKDIHAEASRRYASHVPPGYEDTKEKGIPSCYGDYVGWRQILDFAKGRNSAILFVTDDVKDDWWYRVRGDKTIGPRPELIVEFREECSVPFHMYTTEQFLRLAVTEFGAVVTEEAITEAAQRGRNAASDTPKDTAKAAPSKALPAEEAYLPDSSGLAKASTTTVIGTSAAEDKKWPSS